MFVPHTPGGDLAKRLQEAEDRFVKNSSGGRVKFVERKNSMFPQKVTLKPNLLQKVTLK